MEGKAASGPGLIGSVGRIDKAEHYQTVLYEIDMLRFSYSRIEKPPEGSREADVWAYLESFLVHYRNLLDFFGRSEAELRADGTDLALSRPELIWSAETGLDNRKPDKETLRTMGATGKELRAEFENRQRPDTISRYLQHCTTYRIYSKRWSPADMMHKIAGLLEQFEKYLPPFRPAKESGRVDRNSFLGAESGSTQSTLKQQFYVNPRLKEDDK